MLASALGGWEHLRFEVTEEATPISDGGRWSCTPSKAKIYVEKNKDLANHAVQTRPITGKYILLMQLLKTNK